MSLDRSLKATSSLAKRRSVLKRSERIARLTSSNRFDPQDHSPLALPKGGNAPKPKQATKDQGGVGEGA